jgi:hypothetical protein
MLRGLVLVAFGLSGCSTGPCNGSDALCDVPLDQVTFPGAHNAMSSTDDGFALANQDHGPAQQLHDGVRAMLLDSYDENGVDVLCHQFCTLGQLKLADVLADLKSFLDANPGEVVILVFQDSLTIERTLAAFDDAGLTDRLITPPEPGEDWPTLGKLVRQHRQILLTRESDGDGPAEYAPFYDLAWDTPYSFGSADDFSCDLLRGKKDHALFLINHWLSTPLPTRTGAQEVNATDVLQARVDDCLATAGRKPTVLAVDFYSEGDLFSVVNGLNAP